MSKGVEFNLRKITTEQFAIVETSFDKEKEVELFVDYKFGYSKKDKAVSVYSLVRFEQQKVPFLIIEVGCHFTIAEESWLSFQDKEKDRIIIEKGFMSHLLMLTVGTARGALHVKTESTPFNSYILPPLNVTEVIKEDVII